MRPMPNPRNRLLPRAFALLASLLLALAARAEETGGSDASSREIQIFNGKAKIALAKIQKKMQSFGQDAPAFAAFDKTAVVTSSGKPAPDAAIAHSIEFRSDAKYVTGGPNANGDLPQRTSFWVPNPNGVVFDLFITDRSLLFGASWRKEITVAGKEIEIMYDLELGAELAPLSDKINKAIQDILEKELLPQEPQGT